MKEGSYILLLRSRLMHFHTILLLFQSRSACECALRQINSVHVGLNAAHMRSNPSIASFVVFVLEVCVSRRLAVKPTPDPAVTSFALGLGLLP